MVSPIMRRFSLDTEPTKERIDERRKSCFESSITPILLYDKSIIESTHDDTAKYVENFVKFANSLFNMSHRKNSSTNSVQSGHSTPYTPVSLKEDGIWNKHFDFGATYSTKEATTSSSLLLSPSESVSESYSPILERFSSNSELSTQPSTPSSATRSTYTSSAATSISEKNAERKLSANNWHPRFSESLHEDTNSLHEDTKSMFADTKSEYDETRSVYEDTRSIYEDSRSIHDDGLSIYDDAKSEMTVKLGTIPESTRRKSSIKNIEILIVPRRSSLAYQKDRDIRPPSVYVDVEDPDRISVVSEEDFFDPSVSIPPRTKSLLPEAQLFTPAAPLRTFSLPRRPENAHRQSHLYGTLENPDSPALSSSNSKGTVSFETISDKSSSSVFYDEKAKLGFVATCRLWIQTNYYVYDETPDVLLATAPSDIEKLSYVKLHKAVLCTVGILALLSSSAGMWLFVICGNIFYWFGAIFIIGQLGFTLFQLSSVLSARFDHKKHLETLAKHPIPISKEQDCSRVPAVDVYLPCCKEPVDVIENTYKYVQQLSWPESKLKVHVLDDGAQDEIKDLAAKYNFHYIRRSDRPHLKKAGNLRNAFKETTGDYFMILDADFCPRRDFLLETVPVMEEEQDIGIIQTPQYFRTMKSMGKQTWVERGAGATQELFYRLIQTCRDSWGAVVCAGSCALYRRSALTKLGGTAPLESSEDIFTGFYLALDGYRTKYLPLNLSCGICPDTSRAYFSQQIRWCEGSCSLVLAGEFWKSSLSWKSKIIFWSGLLYYLDQSITPFIMPLCSILLIWCRVDLLKYYNLAFAIPSILFGYWVCRFWSRAKHAKSVQFVNIIQSYAYASAFIDRIVGSSYAWVPSGDAKAHKSNRYRNARWTCIVWTFSTTVALFSGITFQLIKGHIWYVFLPIIALHVFTMHQSIPFMLAA